MRAFAITAMVFVLMLAVAGPAGAGGEYGDDARWLGDRALIEARDALIAYGESTGDDVSVFTDLGNLRPTGRARWTANLSYVEVGDDWEFEWLVEVEALRCGRRWTFGTPLDGRAFCSRRARYRETRARRTWRTVDKASARSGA